MLVLPAAAQTRQQPWADGPRSSWLPPRAQLPGLIGCPNYNVPAAPRPCCATTDRRTSFTPHDGRQLGRGAGHLNMGRIARAAALPGRGLNLSLVGKALVGPFVRGYGKAGTTWHTKPPPTSGNRRRRARVRPVRGSWRELRLHPAAPRRHRSTATPVSRARRDPVRSTSLGLQYRHDYGLRRAVNAACRKARGRIFCGVVTRPGRRRAPSGR
jgi:hypothetical protein